MGGGYVTIWRKLLFIIERYLTEIWPVFLRKIEYFEGLLFLTTNQIHVIDEAFESRITLGIKFPKLEASTRKRIWKKILGGEKKRTGLGLNESNENEKLSEWAAKELNGRQIRNVIRAALLLAQEAGNVLTSDLIDECLDNVVGFMNIIQEEKDMVRKGYMAQWF